MAWTLKINIKGVTGPHGSTGLKGLTGGAGSPGSPGPVGAIGDQGPRGGNGPAGRNGGIGLSGGKGPPGGPGLRGDPGGWSDAYGNARYARKPHGHNASEIRGGTAPGGNFVFPGDVTILGNASFKGPFYLSAGIDGDPAEHRYSLYWGGGGLLVKKDTSQSARRFKENITDLDVGRSAKRLRSLKLKTFLFIDDTRLRVRQRGIIAEEAGEHYPELTHHNEDGEAEWFDYEALVTPLVAAVQYLSDEVEKLEAAKTGA